MGEKNPKILRTYFMDAPLGLWSPFCAPEVFFTPIPVDVCVEIIWPWDWWESASSTCQIRLVKCKHRGIRLHHRRARGCIVGNDTNMWTDRAYWSRRYWDEGRQKQLRSPHERLILVDLLFRKIIMCHARAWYETKASSRDALPERDLIVTVNNS